jgi:hypothetical protein
LKPRNTLIVVGLFALLAAYVFLVEMNKTPEQLGAPTPRPPLYVFQLKASDVKTLEITDLRAPRAVKLTQTESGWQVNQPIEKAADTYSVDSTLDSLASLRATRVLTNVTDLAPFGLLTATLEVRMVMSDTTPYALTVGGKTPNSSNYYAVYTGDKSQVFILDTSVVEALIGWLDTPPYEPTPTPTFTPTPPVTPTVEATPTISATETPKP